MLERKKNRREVHVAVTALVCLGIVCATVLLVGAVASLGVVQGWMQTDQMQYASLVGLWLAAMLGGIVLCVKTKGVPILCGAIVGGAETLLCVIVGALLVGMPTGMGVVVRALSGLTGGILGGVLCTMARSAKRH